MVGTKTESKVKVKAAKPAHLEKPSGREGTERVNGVSQWTTNGSHADGSDLSEDSKDETEKTLEKLVFGDSEGFLNSLKAKSSTKGKELVLGRSITQTGSDEEDEDLGGVADEDVRLPH